jgi:AbrB family looped-hinge helix DNA binding protein
MNITAKITKKGQVTIPREIRKALDSNVVEFEVSGNDVFIRPVRSVAGSLSVYAESYIPIKEIRDSVWDEVVQSKKR